MKLGNKVILLIAIMLITIACGSTNIEPVNDEMISSNSIEDAHSAIQYYFTSPNAGHHCELSSALINDIDHAEQSIDVARYNINMQDIAAALIRAAKRGVHRESASYYRMRRYGHSRKRSSRTHARRPRNGRSRRQLRRFGLR